MQTTLLGLAIAIILALLAALVGPLLINWSGYRALFEAEASHLVGLDVRVTGDIDARLLPSPRLTLHAIEIGGSSDHKILASSLGIEFALGPLMRGEWRASEVHLAGPQISLGLDASGHVQAPNIAVGFNPDGLTIDRLSIENGKVILIDAANGASVTLDRLWFNGEARSLIGPLKGEGAVSIGTELYPFRISAGRYSDDGGLKLHVNVDPVNHPLSIEVDGALMLGGGEPRFDGSLNLARPVGIAPRGAKQAGGTLSQPWRVSGKIKATAAAALMQQVEFQYGSEEQGLKLSGDANFKFGTNPRFDGVLSGRQIDLDRALAAGDGSRPLPAAAIRELAELGGGAFRPAIPIQIGIGIDQVTLGGSTVQNLRGDISTDANGWNLDRFEFRAPGFTQVRLSGHLAVDSSGVAFTGPAEIEAGDPRVLSAWLEGRGEIAQGDLRPLSLRGDVTLGSEKIAVERFKAEFDRKPIAGRLVYVFATANKLAKLDAELNAPELDIDAAFGFGKALLAGSAIERPHDMTIAAEIGRATLAGLAARNVGVRLKIEGDNYQIDRLAVADLGGAAFSASGRIVIAEPSQGSIRVDLDAPDMAPVMALLARYAPDAAQALGRGAPAMAPAKLHARLTVEGGASATQAKFGIDGSLGKVRVALNGQANADPTTFRVGDMRLDGKLESDDGKALVAMLGLDRMVTVKAGQGALTVKASGPANGEMRVDGRLTAGGLEANANGSARPFAAHPSATLNARIVRADMAPLRRAHDESTALPVSFEGRVALAGGQITLADINANIGGTNLRGKLGFALPRLNGLQGELDADTIDGVGLMAAAIGMPASAPSTDKDWVWSTEPFLDGAFGELAGQVVLKAGRLELSPRLTARAFRSTLRFGKREFAFSGMTGDVSGGKLASQISFQDAEAGLTAQVKISLTGADAAVLLPASARPPVTGSLGLVIEMAGTGLSPVALIGSLQGSGKITLDAAQFAGLDPRAFDAVTRAVDRGLTIDSARIADVVRKALESGQLAVKHAEGVIAVSAGQIRLSNVATESKDANLSISGNLDLTDGSIDARLMLSGASEAAGARPDIFMALKGPIAAPSRSIDVSALTGWLTLRAVDNQAKRLRAAEDEAKRLRAIEEEARRKRASEEEARRKRLLEIEANRQQEIENQARRLRESESALPRPGDLAPALPAPVDVGPLPKPGGETRPAASVSPQN